MHGNEHGNSMLVQKCTVRAIRDHEEVLGLRPDTLVKRMKDRLHGLCNSPSVQHITLLTLGNQKILEGWDVLNKELKTKKKVRSQPIVSSNRSWAYGGENFISPSASKICPLRSPTTTCKGRVQGFNKKNDY